MSEADQAQSSTEVEPLLFEGQPVEGQYVQLPALKLEVDQNFARGSYLTLKVEYRVRNVRYDEDRKGVLARHAVLVLDGDAAIVAIESAEDHFAAVTAQYEAEVAEGIAEESDATESDERPNEDRAEARDDYPHGEGALTAEVTEQTVEEVFS